MDEIIKKYSKNFSNSPILDLSLVSDITNGSLSNFELTNVDTLPAEVTSLPEVPVGSIVEKSSLMEDVQCDLTKCLLSFTSDLAPNSTSSSTINTTLHLPANEARKILADVSQDLFLKVTSEVRRIHTSSSSRNFSGSSESSSQINFTGSFNSQDGKGNAPKTSGDGKSRGPIATATPCSTRKRHKSQPIQHKNKKRTKFS